jgi:hypothetical protein
MGHVEYDPGVDIRDNALVTAPHLTGQTAISPRDNGNTVRVMATTDGPGAARIVGR